MSAYVFICARAPVYSVNVFPRWYLADSSNSQVSAGSGGRYLVFIIHTHTLDDFINWQHQETLSLFNPVDSLPEKNSPRKYPVYLATLQRPIPLSDINNGCANIQCCGYNYTQSINVFAVFLWADIGLSPTRRTKEQEGRYSLHVQTNKSNIWIQGPFLLHVSVDCTWLRNQCPLFLWCQWT